MAVGQAFIWLVKKGRGPFQMRPVVESTNYKRNKIRAKMERQTG
jgi:hypothetical protein